MKQSPFAFLAVCLLPFLSYGQDKIASTEPADTYDEFEKIVETSAEAAVVWTINDSINYLPAFDTYCMWNTDRVHPYSYKLSNMKDTVHLKLVSEPCDFHPPFVGHKTSEFGYRRYRYHYGVDIKLLTGDPVSAAFDGVVRIAQYDGDYGKVVVIRHNNGLETLYAHLSKIEVREGQWIEAGDQLGLGGNTGRSTGSHLHFEVRYLGEPIDPNTIINWETGKLKMNTLALNRSHFSYLAEVRAIKYYTIRRGDTLSAIARKHGTTVSKLCQLNKIRSSTPLRVGKTLRFK